MSVRRMLFFFQIKADEREKRKLWSVSGLCALDLENGGSYIRKR